jgi:phosphoglycolate phosphatase-like HAD superfamily hydrolase
VPPPSLDDYRKNITPDFLAFYRDRGMPMSVTAAEMNAIRRSYFAAHWHDAQLRAGARELLEACKNLDVTVFLATAEVYEIGNRRLRELGIRHLIHGWARNGDSRSEDIEDILALMAGRDGYNRSRVLYLDDTASGLLAAKRHGPYPKTAGIAGGFNTEAQLQAAAPDYFVHHLNEVVAIFRS